MLATQFTKHFNFSEFVKSKTASTHGFLSAQEYGACDSEVYDNIQYVAYMLELIRLQLDFPIKISSGYRCPELNKLVGGAPNSNHTLGLAVDINCGKTRNKLLFDLCAQYKQEHILPINELINENNFSWIHISFHKL